MTLIKTADDRILVNGVELSGAKIEAVGPVENSTAVKVTLSCYANSLVLLQNVVPNEELQRLIFRDL